MDVEVQDRDQKKHPEAVAQEHYDRYHADDYVAPAEHT